MASAEQTTNATDETPKSNPEDIEKLQHDDLQHEESNSNQDTMEIAQEKPTATSNSHPSVKNPDCPWKCHLCEGLAKIKRPNGTLRWLDTAAITLLLMTIAKENKDQKQTFISREIAKFTKSHTGYGIVSFDIKGLSETAVSQRLVLSMMQTNSSNYFGRTGTDKYEYYLRRPREVAKNLFEFDSSVNEEDIPADRTLPGDNTSLIKSPTSEPKPKKQSTPTNNNNTPKADETPSDPISPTNGNIRNSVRLHQKRMREVDTSQQNENSKNPQWAELQGQLVSFQKTVATINDTMNTIMSGLYLLCQRNSQLNEENQQLRAKVQKVQSHPK
mmetsp:Transcript_16785/g.23349  ORF Transcript_16785/g.23349 Transcript_16785/m.23349 type:complete len:330 (+) Transcript_16785:155-1144(+)